MHDAALVERVWGDDLRVEGVVVEPLDGIDDLRAAVAAFAPGPGRRLGVLVDHLVPGSKESRIAAGWPPPYVLVTGHPYVDIWQAVQPGRARASRRGRWSRAASRGRRASARPSAWPSPPTCGGASCPGWTVTGRGDAADQRDGASDRLRHGGLTPRGRLSGGLSGSRTGCR